MGMIQLPKFTHPDFTEPGVKPVGPVAWDDSNPMGKDCLGAWYLTRGQELWDATGKHGLATILSNTIGMHEGRYSAEFTSAANNVINTGAMQPALAKLDSFTWVVRAWVNASSAPNRVIFGNRYDGTASPLQFSKATPGKMEYYNGGTYSPLLNYTLTRSKWQTLIIVKDGANFTGYVDGAVSATGTTIFDMDANPLYIGAGGSTGQEEFAGFIEFAAAFTRALLPSEVISFNNNPYQLLKPTIPLEAFYGSAAAGSSFQAVWARNANQIIQVGI